MSDPLERAARAIAVVHGVDPDREGPGRRHADAQDNGTTLIVTDHRGPLWKMWARDARAAILAFLDADEAMVEACAVAISAGWDESDDCPGEMYARESRKLARAAIAALREMLEEKK